MILTILHVKVAAGGVGGILALVVGRRRSMICHRTPCVTRGWRGLREVTGVWYPVPISELEEIEII